MNWKKTLLTSRLFRMQLSLITIHFIYLEEPGQTEKRLHNKFSLGVGGHMNPDDSKEMNVTEELIRELNEEVRLGNWMFDRGY